jgi:hypothetical protein
MPGEFTVLILELGSAQNHRQLFVDEINRRTSSLAHSGEMIRFVDEGGPLPPRLKPDVGVVFSFGPHPTAPQSKALTACHDAGVPMIPVVDDLTNFTQQVPNLLHPYNGFEQRLQDDAAELAGLVLEILGLQRGRRKIFISYSRQDSAKAATQLREALTARWYTVFQDTISIRPGLDFQAALKQELADSDVMLLLNTRSISERPYVQKEIDFADLASIGGVQVIWPGVSPHPSARFFARVDIGAPRLLANETLTQNGLTKVLAAVAASRTAIQEDREKQLTLPILEYARENGWDRTTYMGRYVELTNPATGVRTRVPYVLGLPTSVDFERTWTDASGRNSPPILVHDSLGLTALTGDHFDFLAKRLSVGLLDYREKQKWAFLS